MSELSHLANQANDEIAQRFANATMADFMPASHDGTEAMEQQVEAFWLEAAMTLPDGETRLTDTSVAHMSNGTLTIVTDNFVRDPLVHREFSISKDGDSTIVTEQWGSYDRETDSVVSKFASVVTGPDDVPLPEGGEEASQADLIQVADSLDKWRKVITDLKASQEREGDQGARMKREAAAQTWLSKLVRVLKLGN